MGKGNIRILYISNPMSIHARRWIKAFADRGYDVHLLSPVPWKLEGVETHVLSLYPHGAKNAISRSLSGLMNVRDARKLIKRLSPDILHLHGLFTVAAPDLMLVTFRQKNLIVSTWGSDVVFEPKEKESFRSSAIKKFIFRQATVVLATSHFQSRVTQQYCPTYRKVITTPFGVDLELFKKNGEIRKDPEVVTVGFVKRLEENYGPHILLEAFKIVEQRHKNTRLMIIGEGSLKKKLMQMASQWGIHEKVMFPGHIENDLIPRYLAQMDLFVMPTSHETFGVAAVEAQAAEVPVIATNIEGVREVVIHNQTGFLVDNLDPSAIARRMMELIEDPEKRKRMGIAGRTFVSQHYDWEKNVGEVERIYRDVLRRS